MFASVFKFAFSQAARPLASVPRALLEHTSAPQASKRLGPLLRLQLTIDILA